MTDPIAEAPLRLRVRITGVVYLLYFVAAVASVAFAGGIVVPGDAAATARNLLANEARLQLGFAIGLVASAAYVALTAFLFEILAPVDRGLSRLAAFFSLMGCAIQTIGALFEIAPLAALKSSPGPETLQLAATFLDLHRTANDKGLVFFALYCLLLGLLVFRSSFLPRFLGVLLMAAGVGWLSFLMPAPPAWLSHSVQGFGFLAELAFMLWLLVKGVDVQRWRERAAAAR
jgi:hypothetical protein